MAWEITAYAIALSVLAIAVAAIFGVIRVVRTLGRAERTLARVGSETEISLRQARLLAEEATAITRSSRQAFESIAAFAEGARALGDAAQAAGEAASQVSAFWRDRLIFRRANEPAADDDGAQDARADWQSVLKQIWRAWRNRSCEADDAEGSRYPGTSADQA
ncbi:DUF948 domain-containing protein [Cohnella yongneupensis]|uniref:DUF948 domain-containing protein n=1 Tax=Cohnella yongneupensis TaxID=425006 RepID=A0ABW0QY09_9BACL